MRCTKCNYHFCWLCLGNYADHSDKTGGFFSCNKFEVTEGFSAPPSPNLMAPTAPPPYRHPLHHPLHHPCHQPTSRLRAPQTRLKEEGRTAEEKVAMKAARQLKNYEMAFERYLNHKNAKEVSGARP